MEKSKNLELIEEFLKKFLAEEELTQIQAFDTRNIAGDYMETVYMYPSRNLIVDYCRGYNYIEIFGLTSEEFQELINIGLIY